MTTARSPINRTQNSRRHFSMTSWRSAGGVLPVELRRIVAAPAGASLARTEIASEIADFLIRRG